MTEASPQILLVGKHHERVRHLDKYLASTGWRYSLAKDSSAVRAALESSEFDLVIADLEFSGPEGSELFHLVRQTSPGQAIIVVSHDGSIKEATRVLRAGALDFLQYPLDFDTLERSVKDVFSRLRKPRRPDRHFQHIQKFQVEYSFTSVELAEQPFELDILDELERIGFLEENDRLRITLAFQEAITNSLEHGNLELKSEWKDELEEDGIDQYSLRKKSRLADPKYAQRTIHLTVGFTPEALTIEIEDQGPGFQSDGKGASEQSGGILCYGRGMAIIGSAMDLVQYHDEGRTIEMRHTFKKV